MRPSIMIIVSIALGLGVSLAVASPCTEQIAKLGDAPNFGDFEVGQINNRGDLVFVSETETCVDTGLGFSFCEGAFLGRGAGDLWRGRYAGVGARR